MNTIPIITPTRDLLVCGPFYEAIGHPEIWIKLIRKWAPEFVKARGKSPTIVLLNPKDFNGYIPETLVDAIETVTRLQIGQVDPDNHFIISGRFGFDYVQ